MEKREVRIDYNKLEKYVVGEISFTKRNYLVVNDEQDVDYFEVKRHDGETYCTSPNDDLTLTGNMGDSLTHLNEQVIMQRIVDNLKRDILSHKIIGESLQEFVDLIKVNIANDQELIKMLFTPLKKYTEDDFSVSINILLNYFEGIYNNTISSIKPRVVIAPQSVPANEPSVAPNETTDILQNDDVIEDNFLEKRFDDKSIEEVLPIQSNNEANVPSDTEIEAPVVIPEKNETTVEKTITNPFGVPDEELDDATIEGLLLKKSELNDDKIQYLKNLQSKRALEVRSQGLKKDKQKKLKAPNKAAAFIDIVLWALVAQLVAVGILILIVTFK